MNTIQNDKKVIQEGRKNALTDNEEQGLQVTAPLRDQIQQKLVDKLKDLNMGHKTVEMWHQANAERAEWLERQEKYLVEVDEFIDPIYNSPTDWSSNLHLPTILTVVKTMHARMYSALMGIDPPFTVKPRKASYADRASLVQELMRYTMKDWANNYEGVEGAVDRWIWDWVMRGVGILKCRWNREFTRFVDVEEVEVQGLSQVVNESTGEIEEVPVVELVEREVERTIEKFSGPCLERVMVEDMVLVGGEGDPQKADAVIQSCYFTASDLWSYADQKIFDKEGVEKVIQSGEDMKNNEHGALLKQRQVETAGLGSVDKTYDLDRYEILECYVRVDVDGSGVNSDVVLWVHKQSHTILRATYLYRIMKSGMRPFFKIDFHLRHGVEYGVGLVEMLYSLGKEIDAMHNMNIDTGIMSSMPFGFYRPTSNLKEEKLAIEPGALLPLDQPQRDIYFPNLGSRVSFGFQEQNALQQQIERLTSISDMSLGLLAGQGAARTATGARAVIGEANANLDIFVRRMNRGWKQALKYVFELLQARLPAGFQFRLLGDDGNAYWQEVQSREEIQGLFDFELEPNSANSNPQIQLEQANLLYQATQNVMDLQLGLITPLERYNAIQHYLKANKIHDFAKYIRKPDEGAIKYTPIEIADRILSGLPFRFDPTQDLQGFVELVEMFKTEEELNGQLSQNELASLIAAQEEAQGMLEAMQQQRAQNAANQQQLLNAQAAQMPGNMVNPDILSQENIGVDS